MGQRLNVEIMNGEKVLANGYFHWSAYSESSLETIAPIIAGINAGTLDGGTDADALDAICMLEATGAGLTDEERAAACNMFPTAAPFAECPGRNSGLIAITESGMETTREWEEGRITLHVDRSTFDYDVLWHFPRNQYEVEVFPDNEVALDDLPVLAIDINEIPYGELNTLLAVVKEKQSEIPYFRINGTGADADEAYSFIY